MLSRGQGGKRKGGLERVGRRRYRKIRANGEQGRSVWKEPEHTFNHKIQNIFPFQAAPPFMLMDGKLSEKRLSSVAGCHMATEVRRTLHSLGHTFTLDRLSLFGTLRVSKSDKRRDGRLRLWFTPNDTCFRSNRRRLWRENRSIGERVYRELRP